MHLRLKDVSGQTFLCMFSAASTPWDSRIDDNNASISNPYILFYFFFFLSSFFLILCFYLCFPFIFVFFLFVFLIILLKHFLFFFPNYVNEQMDDVVNLRQSRGESVPKHCFNIWTEDALLEGILKEDKNSIAFMVSVVGFVCFLLF